MISSSPSKSRKWKRIAYPILKLVFGLVIVAYLFHVIPLKQMVEVVRGIDLFWLVFSILLNLASVFVWAIRLKTLLTGKLPFTLNQILVSYFFGLFVGSILPSSLGGDLGQFYHLQRKSTDKGFLASAIIVNRVTGVLALMVFVVVAGVWRYPAVLHVYWWIWTIVIIGMAFLYVVVTHRGIAEKFGLGFLPNKIRSPLVKVYEAFYYFGHHKRALFWAILLGIVYQGMNILVVALLGFALHVRVAWTVWMVTVPLVSLIVLLPISIAGLGIQDASYVGLLSTFAGIATPQALAISILIHLSRLIFAAIGAMIYAWDMIHRPRNISPSKS